MASLHKTTKRHGQRRGEDPVAAASKTYGPKKTEFREPKPRNASYSHKKEPSLEGMPVITLGSGNYIQDVKSGIITYCQRIDMSKIAKILATGRFDKKVEVVIDNDKLGTTADPHGIYKDAITNEIRQTAQDYRDYIKSKEKLTGIIRSMTSKEVDEKLEQLFTLLLATRDAAFDLLPNPPSAAENNAFGLANPIVDTSCPVQLWRNKVFLITTKTTRSKRLDDPNVCNLKAKDKREHLGLRPEGESCSGHLHPTENHCSCG